MSAGAVRAHLAETEPQGSSGETEGRWDLSGVGSPPGLRACAKLM